MPASWTTRPQLQEAVRNERAYWLERAKRMEEHASRAFLRGNDDEAKGYREVAANFRQRALGNPTPETEMHS
jgi:hypothetical protein